MALFVLQIAENGPAAVDGRLKVKGLYEPNFLMTIKLTELVQLHSM